MALSLARTEFVTEPRFSEAESGVRKGVRRVRVVHLYFMNIRALAIKKRNRLRLLQKSFKRLWK
jgi:hypothetical protein